MLEICLADVDALLSLLGECYQGPKIDLPIDQRCLARPLSTDPLQADIAAPRRFPHQLDGKSTGLTIRERHLEWRVVLPSDPENAGLP
jgi:hypothetical protein